MFSLQDTDGLKSSYAGLAKISCLDENELVASNLYEKSSRYYGSENFENTGLYRPFGINSDNPLGKNVYSYSLDSATAIRGIAFSNGGSGFVNNPLSKSYKIVDNSYEYGRVATNSDFNDVLNLTRVNDGIGSKDESVEIEAVGYKTYEMADVFRKSPNMVEINYRRIPKSLALTKQSKFREFWGSQVELVKGLKNKFLKNKIK